MWLQILAIFALVSCSNVLAVQVDTPSGPIEGYVSTLPDSGNAVTTFKGIPYAQPPVGELRFEKPLPVTPWTDLFKAENFSAKCIQPEVDLTDLFNAENFSAGSIEQEAGPEDLLSEDCLTLNIYVPGNLTADKIAVMIWIHGGGVQAGSSRDYDGSLLATTGDVIVVTINYRLNFFGFLNSDGAAPSNVGLWDQHLAIRWVRDNIAAFGGDVSRITIFGESGGAWSVALQTMSPQNNDSLFQRAIQQSGGYLMIPLGRTDSNVSIMKMAERIGCSDASTNVEVINCFKNLPIATLQEKLRGVLESFMPIKDDEFIMDDPFKLLAQFTLEGAVAVENKVGNLASYETMIGYNSQEGMLSVIFGIYGPMNRTSFMDKLGTVALGGEDLTPAMRAILSHMAESLYSGKVPPSIASRSMDDQRLRMATDAWGDLNLVWPTIESALLHSAVATTSKKTYVYEFDHKRSDVAWLWFEGPEWLRTGADHADELSFIFGRKQFSNNVLSQNFTEAENALSTALVKYWTNFAKTGNPGTQSMVSRGGVTWPVFEEQDKNYLRFTTDTDVIESTPLGGLADFWRSAVVASVTTPQPKLDSTIEPSRQGPTTINSSNTPTAMLSLIFSLLALPIVSKLLF